MYNTHLAHLGFCRSTRQIHEKNQKELNFAKRTKRNTFVNN